MSEVDVIDVGIGKTSWPELVGQKGEVAAATIERENKNVHHAIVVLDGSKVTMDFRCDRVWVWVSKNGIVNHVLQIG